MDINETALLIYAACVSIYIILMQASSALKINTAHAVIMGLYSNWIITRLKDKNLNTAIQALRNIVMGNTAYISALILLLGILVGLNESGIFKSEPLLFGYKSLSLGNVQMTITSSLVIFCLLNFILAIRMMNRAAILMCAYPEKAIPDNPETLPELPVLKHAFASGQNHLILGIRGIFYLVPAMAWIANPHLFIFLSIVVTVYLIFFHDLRPADKL